jgi:hypothetical protein
MVRLAARVAVVATLLAAAGPASARPVGLRFAVPAGHVERATLVLRVAHGSRSGVVVRDAIGHRVAGQRGPLRRGRVLWLDVTRALRGAPVLALSLSPSGRDRLAFASGARRPRLVPQVTPAAPPPGPVVPATETAPPPSPAADPHPVVLAPPPPPAPAPAPAEPDGRQQALLDMLGDVTTADGRRYAAIDDRALPLDGLKIIESAPGQYVGIYHALDAGMFRLKVATSRDLLNWRWRADLDTQAAQGAIAKAADGSYVVVYEKSSGDRVQLRFRSYDSLEQLLAGKQSREFTAPLTLAPTAEGTPNIESVDQDTITIGFHYYRDALVDRQAQGTLTGFGSWSAQAAPELDELFAPFAVHGNIGDRDWFELDGHAYALQEA